MKKLTPLLLIAALFAPLSSYAADVATPVVAGEDNTPDIGIGGGETAKQTHLDFDGIPADTKIIAVTTRLIVDKVAPTGLNFFAIQVNFANNTWAHGGPQYVNGGTEQVNWGGLVNRGGGSADYTETDWSKDLLLIQCGFGQPNTLPFQWNRNTEYILKVERGGRFSLPASTVKVDGEDIAVPARTMWMWLFTMTPADNSHEPYTSFILDSSDHISSFYLWNESGYGSTSTQQHALWSMPTYRILGKTGEFTPTGYTRF